MKSTDKTNAAHDVAVAILGIPFDQVNVREAITRIEQMVASRKPHYLVTANVDFLVQARADVELRRILLDSDLVLCDGTPLLWASRLLGNALPERVAGSDLAPLLLNIAAEKGYKVFLLGATPDSAQTAMQLLQASHPNLFIDSYSPPFNKLLEMDHDEIRRRILSAAPDILLVSFGCPKQEKWIAMHYRELGVPVSIGVGATIDFLAGRVRRAPLWMQRSGTEWVYRLLQEPKRLAGRYSKDLWVFGTAFLSQIAIANQSRLRPNPTFSTALVDPPVSDAFHLLHLPPVFDKDSISTLTLPVQRAVSSGRHLVLDSRRVSSIDSTAMAMLVRWRRAMRSIGSAIVLLAPSPPVERALSFGRLRDFFLIATDTNSVDALLKDLRRNVACVTANVEEGELVICWRGEVTAGTSPQYSEPTVECIAREFAAASIRVVKLDLSSVSFIDSTGLGLLIRIRKRVNEHAAKLTVTGLQPAVLNVIRLAQLESLFTDSPAVDKRRRWPLHGPFHNAARQSV